MFERMCVLSVSHLNESMKGRHLLVEIPGQIRIRDKFLGGRLDMLLIWVISMVACHHV